MLNICCHPSLMRQNLNHENKMGENVAELPSRDSGNSERYQNVVQVDVRLTNDREFRCGIALPIGESLQEFMNGPERFIFVRTLADEMHLLRKDTIEEIYEVSTSGS